MTAERIPTFVVVGHVNKGKSSVVATLLEDPTIPIDLVPGTTTEARAYDFRVEGQPVFRLVDTPGFQEAAAALAWLEEHAEDASTRRDALQAFVDTFADGDRFQDEVQLLRPLLAEGPVGVLYVVDASRPYRATHEAEMEVLRWSGCPGMALLNRIGDQDHSEAWRQVLQQFFSVVRGFHAHAADAEDRLRLLATFGELQEAWSAPLTAAVEALRARLQRRDHQARELVATYLIEAWCHVETRSFDPASAPEEQQALADDLVQRYRRRLRALEEDCRRGVEAVYGFAPLEHRGHQVEPTPEDLFDQKSWRLYGLTRRQWTARAAAAGGVAGGVLDLFSAGMSLGTGVALGSAVGAAGAWFGSRRLAEHWTPRQAQLARFLPGDHGHLRAFGPIANEAFAWILLDRALIHLGAVQHRAHARRDPLDLETMENRARNLPSEARGRVDDVLRACRKAGRQGQQPKQECRDTLAQALAGNA